MNQLEAVIKRAKRDIELKYVYVMMPIPQLQVLIDGLEEAQKECEYWKGYGEESVRMHEQWVDERKELQRELEEKDDALTYAMNQIQIKESHIRKIEKEHEEMKKSLEWYASDYAQTINDEAPIIRLEYPEHAQTYYEMDEGHKARTVLSNLSKEIAYANK